MNDLSRLTVWDINLLAKLPATTSLRVLAATLGIEASHLSRAVKNLEDILGIKLLHRSNKGVHATTEALALAQKAMMVCDAVKDLSTKSSFGKKPYRRFINIGSRGFINSFIAPDIVSAFERQMADSIGLGFYDLSPDESIAAARGAVIDVLVGFEDSSLGKHWHMTEVGMLHWKAYGRPRNDLLTAGGRVDFSSVRIGHHCAFDGKNGTIKDGLLFDAMGIRQLGHGAQSASTALAIASATDQFACVPEVVAAPFIANRKIVEYSMGEHQISTTVYLSIHEERIHKGELKLLSGILRASFGVT